METRSVGLSLLLLAAAMPAQTWTQLSPTTSPTTRRAGALCFDPLSGGLLMYGGLQSGPTLTLGETWSWTGTDWVQRTPATQPPPRWGHRMVYDIRRGRVVTFGGRSPTTTATANDTWEWDGNDWQQVFPPQSPNARAFYSMAYDERRGVVVVYGTQSGSTLGTSGGNQTWEYDGITWTQAVTATVPPGLETPAMAYDAGRGVVVMFGGWNGSPPGTMYDTTWEYDGVDWTLRNPANKPAPRYRAACCYDRARGRVVLYGGFGNATALQDTWEYDGVDWTQVANVGPARSTESYMAYDELSSVPLHFGGSGPTGASNETWLFVAPTTAIAAPFGQGCATSAGVPSLTPASTPVLGTTYSLALANGALTTIALVVHGLENTVFAPGVFLPLDLGALGIAGCRLETTAELLVTEVVQNGAVTHGFQVPATASLTGLGLYSQVLVLDAAAPNGFAGMSNAVHGVLGL